MEVMQTHLLSASLQMELECSRCMFKPFLHYSIWIGIAISKPVFHIGKQEVDYRAFCMISLMLSYISIEEIRILL